jgi:hypothetical protein
MPVTILSTSRSIAFTLDWIRGQEEFPKTLPDPLPFRKSCGVPAEGTNSRRAFQSRPDHSFFSSWPLGANSPGSRVLLNVDLPSPDQFFSIVLVDIKKAVVLFRTFVPMRRVGQIVSPSNRQAERTAFHSVNLVPVNPLWPAAWQCPHQPIVINRPLRPWAHDHEADRSAEQRPRTSQNRPAFPKHLDVSLTEPIYKKHEAPDQEHSRSGDIDRKHLSDTTRVLMNDSFQRESLRHERISYRHTGL